MNNLRLKPNDSHNLQRSVFSGSKKSSAGFLGEFCGLKKEIISNGLLENIKFYCTVFANF